MCIFIAAFCGIIKTTALLAVVFLVAALSRALEETPEEHFAKWGSFTDEDTCSFDGKLLARQRVEKRAYDNVKMVVIDVVDVQSGQVIDSFPAERAWDFWGICFESGSYNIWVQSGDVGVYCFEYVDGKWKENHDLERPADVISKYDKEVKELRLKLNL